MAKKKKNVDTFDPKEALRKVKILYTFGRIKESIAYLYMIYTKLVARKYNVTKRFSQTIRDFAIVMVKQYNQNPQLIYPFIKTIEKAIYGGIKPDERYFNEVVEKFKPLYQELTGEPLPAVLTG